ncbi:MAG: IS110 family transposase [Candidatus Binatia bacterium]
MSTAIPPLQRRQRKTVARGSGLPASLKTVHVNAAGIDVGSAEHYVAVPEDRDPQPVRRFECFTADLDRLADWLEGCRIDTVVMESTGVYWIPLFQILDRRGFEVKLVNARHVKNVPGRKSDVQDCQWLQQLHTFGLLAGSFRPADQICVLRSYIRQRDTLIRDCAAHIQRMQKALTQMNVQLHKVISDITGTTGLRIMRAILDGERDPVRLALLKDPRIRSSREQIAKALHGDYRPEHLFALRQSVELYDTYRKMIGDCDGQIEHYLASFDTTLDPTATPLEPLQPTSRKPRGNQPHFDLRSHLHRIAGVDFTRIDGFDALTVQTLLSEVGLDPSRFPSAKHFASWVALCPDNRITGGAVKSSKTRKVASRVATALRRAAQAAGNSHTALGAFHRRMRARLGPAAAITATAHKLARIFYHMWKYRHPYHDPGVNYYETKYRERTLRSLSKRAASLGFQLVQFQPVSADVS